ncbi:MAG: hypothetical protein ACTSRP_12725 [Candidatus Helarchaeota archaeon]
MLKSIHVLKMEKTGPEIILNYPKSGAVKSELEKKILKLLPFNAKHGEIFTLTSEEKLVYLSYVFTLEITKDESQIYMLLE